MTIPQLDQETQARLLNRYSRGFAAGEVLFAEGDPANEAYLLQEGRVRLVKRIGSIERSLRQLRPGDLFGESALAPGVTRGSTAVATTDGSVLSIDQRTLEQILSTHPAVGMRVMQQMVRRLRDAEDQIEVLMLPDARSKVVVAILKLAQQEQAGEPNGQDRSIVLAISPTELAARVGLDLDTVKGIVQGLRGSGHLHISGERIQIPRLEPLMELWSLLTLRDRIMGHSYTGSDHDVRNDNAPSPHAGTRQ